MNATHLPSPTNPRINLHQEYTMRTGGFDDLARVESVRHGWGSLTGPTSPTRFKALVDELGLEGAIRDVATCAWLSESDWSKQVDLRGETCRECLEVARS